MEVGAGSNPLARSLRKFGGFLNREVNTKSHLLELNLLLLALAIGIQDAVSYPDFQCFASNQTGGCHIPATAHADAK